MNATICEETVGATILGVWLWAFFRQIQKFAPKRGESAGYYFLTVRPWLSSVCGRPLPDNQLELGLTLGQIGAVLVSISWLPMVWFGLSHTQRVVIYFAGYLGAVIVSAVVRVIVIIANRFG